MGVPLASVSDRLASQRGVSAVRGAGGAAPQTAPGTAGRLVGEAGKGNGPLEIPRVGVQGKIPGNGKEEGG